LGVITVQQALQIASEHGLDLVEVAPNAEPPVCRLVDYGKLRYAYAKRDRESRKGQKNAELREVRFRPNIGAHDMESKLRKVRELIGDGSKVKITVRLFDPIRG
jgi:translation initiation factor IF-3